MTENDETQEQQDIQKLAEEYTRPLCTVCKEKESVISAVSSLVEVQVHYCQDCLDAEAEPYALTLAVCQDLDGPRDIHPTKRRSVSKTRRYFNKTYREFWEDVQKLKEEIDESIERAILDQQEGGS